MRVVGGHQRIEALKQIGLTQVEVLIPDRKLTDKEFKRILIRDNLPFGEFDFDMLGADYDAAELLDIGMPKEWLPKEPVADGGENEDEPEGGEEIEPQLIHCPKCKHEFSIMTEKKK